MQEEKLLQRIYQGANTGIYSIQTVMPKITDSNITDQLSSYQGKLEAIARTAEQMMRSRGMDYKEQDVMAKAGIWAGVQWNSMMDHSASHIADMVIQGNTMGITEMVGAINHSPMIDCSVRELGTELVNAQRRNIEIMKRYL